jgi:hypothetical protein
MRPDPEVVIVLGRRGQGKSTWTKRYVLGVPRLAVWDPKRSYAVEYPDDLAAWFEANEQTPRYRIGHFLNEHQETLGSIAFAKQDTCLVLEECAFVFNPKKELDEWARECIYLGRERGVSIVAVAQRPKSIHIGLRSQATRIICFNQHELSDVDWITESFDFTDFEQIRTLNHLECLDITAHEVKRYTLALPTTKPTEETAAEPPSDEDTPAPMPWSTPPESDDPEPADEA